ncbi:MAG: DMT family transporter [Spirochaetia bacterium]|jgi:drug/metabolite transporter (DMT)-like permease
MNEQSSHWHAGPILALGLGVAAVSFASILISFARAEGLPALSIAALRMTVAALVVAPVGLLRCRAEIRILTRKDLVLAVTSGLFLALHFGFWTSSLDSTSVMSSVVFVSTNPLFVVAASALLFKEALRPATLLGIGLALVGGIVIGFSDAGRGGPAAARGDLMALLGAVSASGYLLVGRRLRTRMSLPLYVGISSVTAASALLGVVGLTGMRLAGYPASGYLWVLLLALGPQLLGHTSYNYALKYVSATFVAVTLLGEPIGASLLAIPLLSQVPSGLRIVGGLCILAGIFFAARAEAGSSGVRGPGK